MAIRVLVVDDSSFFRRRLTEILSQDAELEVIDTANNGKEAVEKALALRPDVITMDIEMPVLNGIEFIKQLNLIYEKSAIPLIFISAKVNPEDISEGLSLGALDYIKKPFTIHELTEKINQILNSSPY